MFANAFNPPPAYHGRFRVSLYLWLIMLLLGSVFAGQASAHDWYPAICCSSQDCYPIDRNDVKATPQGWYIVKERVTIPYEAARPSPDGRFHICRNELGKGTLITPGGQPPCFWAPEGAS